MHQNGLALPLFQPTWLEDTQLQADHHQIAKQVPTESISIGLSIRKMFRDNVNITTKKELAQKLMLNAHNVKFSCVWSKRKIVLKKIIFKKRA